MGSLHYSEIPTEFTPPLISPDIIPFLAAQINRHFDHEETSYRVDDLEFVYGEDVELDGGPCSTVNIYIERLLNYINKCEEQDSAWDIKKFINNIRTRKANSIWFEKDIRIFYNQKVFESDIVFTQYSDIFTFGIAMLIVEDEVHFLITSPIIIGTAHLNNTKRILYRLSPNNGSFVENYKIVGGRRIQIGIRRDIGAFNKKMYSALTNLKELATNNDENIIYQTEG